MTNKINAQIVADSVNENGNRITTFLLTYPRIIHAELLTHRSFSRNAASSRAIPTKKMIESIRIEPFIPIAWQKNHSGMQGTEYLNEEESANARELWINAKTNALISCQQMINNDITKQIANRLLEPFQYYTSLVTATDFENFFALRCPQYVMEIHDDYDELVETKVFRSKKDIINQEPNWYIRKDENKRFGKFPADMTEMDWLYFNKGAAEIHLMDLAEKMWDAINESTPNLLHIGAWHIPFANKIDNEKLELLVTHNPKGIEEIIEFVVLRERNKIKVSTGMSARTSYTTVGDEKEVKYETLIGIHDKMINQRPFHASPFEHCAQANGGRRSRNFVGFTQYREIIENGLI